MRGKKTNILSAYRCDERRWNFSTSDVDGEMNMHNFNKAALCKYTITVAGLL